MGIEAYIVLIVIGLLLGLLIFETVPVDALMLGALTVLMVVPVPGEQGWKLGVLGIKDALAGFSNSGMITVGVLFVVVQGLQATGGMDWIAQTLLGRPQGLRPALLRLFGVTGGMSVFLNNTPVVAMMIPAVSDWSRRLRISPSKLMMPISYAAILGGMCSLIGTSTNLVVAGLVVAHTPEQAPLGMFDITWIGLPATIAGGLYLVLLGPRLLPQRGSPAGVLGNTREYTGEMLVPSGSQLVGRTIEQAGLRNLPGAYLVEIERNGDIIAAVGPEQVLRANDRLVFAGVVDSIRDLQNQRGLAPATDQVFKLNEPRYRRRLFEAVVSDTCAVVGRSIREGRFRTVYNAAVLAVARNGERVGGKIGDIVLRAGDMLLIEASPAFESQQRNSRDFFMVKTLEDSAPRRHERAWVAVVILVAMVTTAAMEWLDMLHVAMLAAAAMLLTRCCTITDARRSVDWSVLTVIAAALGLGAALEKSGAAKALAGSVLAAAGDNPWAVLAAVYIVTWVLTEFITNNAAVAMTFPIALATAKQLNVNFTPFIFAIMMAGSAGFTMPLGYQTHLMVYGPGGYVFKDFIKIGLPLSLIVAALTIVLTPLIWPLK